MNAVTSVDFTYLRKRQILKNENYHVLIHSASIFKMYKEVKRNFATHSDLLVETRGPERLLKP